MDETKWLCIMALLDTGEQMYVLLVPRGGFNDCMCVIHKHIQYCIQHNRTLLVYRPTNYDINLSDYFTIRSDHIIYDSDEIIELMLRDQHSIYRNIADVKELVELLKRPYASFKYVPGNGGVFMCNGVSCACPSEDVPEDIIVSCCCGGGQGYSLFKDLCFTDILKDHCRHLLRTMGNAPYICLQVRHTDYKCDYKQLYEDNKEHIHQYKTVCLCTDNEEVLHFYRGVHPNVVNFTTFPSCNKALSLHSSSVQPDIKIKNLIGDLLMATNSDEILSNSKGGFIQLLRTCFAHKNDVLAKIA